MNFIDREKEMARLERLILERKGICRHLVAKCAASAAKFDRINKIYRIVFWLF